MSPIVKYYTDVDSVQQYAILRDVGVPKSSINKLRMMTKERKSFGG